MGKLKEHCLAIHDQYSDEVLAHYARFLEFAWHNRANAEWLRRCA
jgi:hypothetical protein